MRVRASLPAPSAASAEGVANPMIVEQPNEVQELPEYQRLIELGNERGTLAFGEIVEALVVREHFNGFLDGQPQRPLDHASVEVLVVLHHGHRPAIVTRTGRTAGAVRMLWLRALAALRQQLDDPTGV